MEPIIDFFELDFSSLMIHIFIVMAGFIAAAALVGKISEIIGKPVRWIRKKNEDHELLVKTVQSLNGLRDKHAEDVLQSISHDKAILDALKRSETELTQSIKALADSNSSRDRQIHTLIIAERESLADRINQKYKHYIAINGIPEDEVSEFTNLHAAYKGLKGNHSSDAKYKYCIEKLPIIPVEIKLAIENDSEEP